MISSSPRSSLRYLILDFIDLFALSPITGSDDSNHLVSIGKPYCQNAATDLTETIETLLPSSAVRNVSCDYAPGIKKSQLRYRERNSVFFLIRIVFFRIPLKARLCHG